MINRFLAILIALLPLVANAQLAIGEWEFYSSYKPSGTYNNNMFEQPFVGYKMAETPDYVYYVANGSLFAIDKSTDELIHYNAINKLSDSKVNGIWYNADKKYLLIGYESANMDMLYDNGKIVNLPDIKDASLTIGKTIYDVAFDGDNIFVGTSFGLVKYNDTNYYVEESGIYNYAIQALAVVDNHLVVYSYDDNMPDKYYLFFAPKDVHINNFSNFKRFPYGNFWGHANSLRALDGNKALVRKNSGGYKLFLLEFDFAKSNCTLSADPIVADNADYPIMMKDGSYFVKCNNKAVIISKDGSVQSYALSSPLNGQAIMSFSGINSVWTQGKDGVSQWNASADPATKLKDFGTSDQLTIEQPNQMKYFPSNRMYVNNMTESNIYGTGSWWEQRTCIFENGGFHDVTASYVTPLNSADPAAQLGEKLIRDVYDIAEDPEDPDTYYAATRWEGIYKLTKNSEGNYVESAHYYSNNSPLTNVMNGGVAVTAIAFDRFNNLWAINSLAKAETNKYVIYVLPAEARKKATTTKSDWIQIKVPGLAGELDAKMLVCQKSNMIFFMDGVWDTKIVAYDTKGTASFDDDTYYVWERFVDQDGKTFTKDRYNSIIEDQDGRVWIGTQNGVLQITNPSEATNPNMTFTRIKMPRKDGSGFADYLLDSQRVMAIAVDGANKKWIGTASSGLYYVTPTGDEILEHFTSDNSDLTTDKINTLACDPNGNSVFVGTPDGVFRYNSTTAPSAQSFDDVYAYPNPVRPDYTGWITIKGLMDGSRVKIADASGSVFLDTVSEGGMVTWDGCNRNGDRVRTGVYYVYASKTGEGLDNQAAVTKILVVN